MWGWGSWALGMGAVVLAAPVEDLRLTPSTAERFTALALKCVDQEYPNKLDHVMNHAGEVLSPKVLHPAFHGCLDWHSAVHGHWVLVRLLRLFPDSPQADQIRKRLDAHLAPEPIAAELAYLGQGNRASFERTYGWAWLLKLSAELKEWDSPEARHWGLALKPLVQAIRDRFMAYLPKATYPIRTGVHPNTAYSLNLAMDYALVAQDTEFEVLIRERATHHFSRDRRVPLAWEPGAEDFLSPSLEEAALMARLMPAQRFRQWFSGFLPGGLSSLKPAVVSDRNDPKIVHLDGLNLSRARCLYRLAAVWPKGPKREVLVALGDLHARASLPHIASGSYEGEHWLGTFALHLLEARAGVR